MIRSRSPKVSARIWAVRSPTNGIPSPLIRRFKGCLSDDSRFLRTFKADLAPIRSIFTRSSRVNLYRSATFFTSPESTRLFTSTSPNPSMSMTPRAAKWSTDSLRRAGQFVLIQRLIASPSTRTTSSPQSGQFLGITNGRRCSPSLTTRTTLGITSPARSTSTVSPICTPNRPISSSL